MTARSVPRTLLRVRAGSLGLSGWFRARLLAWTHPGADIGRGVRIRARCRFIIDPTATLQLGDGCEIDTGTTVAVYGNGTLHLGERAFVGHHGTLAAHRSVTIGAGTFLAELVSIRDHDHALGEPPSSGNVEVAPVVIGRDVWLGAKTTVLRGAEIGDGAVVAAHAVVRGTIPAGALAAGIPARVVRGQAGERGT